MHPIGCNFTRAQCPQEDVTNMLVGRMIDEQVPNNTMSSHTFLRSHHHSHSPPFNLKRQTKQIKNKRSMIDLLETFPKDLFLLCKKCSTFVKYCSVEIMEVILCLLFIILLQATNYKYFPLHMMLIVMMKQQDGSKWIFNELLHVVWNQVNC